MLDFYSSFKNRSDTIRERYIIVAERRWGPLYHTVVGSKRICPLTPSLSNSVSVPQCVEGLPACTDKVSDTRIEGVSGFEDIPGVGVETQKEGVGRK